MLPPPLGLQPSPQLVQTPAVDIPDRYELKYLIPDWQTDAIRRAIEPFCEHDPHAREEAGHQYQIQSLYFDTRTRGLYGMSRERRARRWKMRIRSYDGAQSVFLEIKSKDHDLVKKQRAVIPAAGWQERVQAWPIAETSLAERIFRERLERYQLVPTLMVRYQREAWLSTVDAYARVTFDRRVECQPWSDWSLDADERSWIALDDEVSMAGVRRGVVLELKCLRAVPRWLSELTRALCLPKARYSKFCRGIDRVYGRGVSPCVLDQT